MSTRKSIAAVTVTLQKLLESVCGKVTTKPLDLVRPGGHKPHLNLFLYRVSPNAAFRNMDIPQRTKPGTTGQSLLPLTLSYLISAYGGANDDSSDHEMLGRAMLRLHDHPILGRQEIIDATGHLHSGLEDQPEKVKLTLQPLSVEEISKLWSSFQTHYRLSAAYEASVVLIESLIPERPSPLVLRRGADDYGPRANVVKAPAELSRVLMADAPRTRAIGKAGDRFEVRGTNLGDCHTIRFTNGRSGSGFDLPAKATAGGLEAQLPNPLPTAARAGLHTLAAVSGPPGRLLTSSVLPFALAPNSLIPPTPWVRIGNRVSVTVVLDPRVDAVATAGSRHGYTQPVALVLNRVRPAAPGGGGVPVPPVRREIPAVDPGTVGATNSVDFVFDVPASETGDYQVQIRVDGIDLPSIAYVNGVPRFDPAKEVTIS